jgi:3-hydroxyisobutyrate dehydrogenase
MGRSMAGHLMDAGHSLRIYNRTKAKAASLLEKGARWCSTPAEVCDGADTVFTILGYPEDVEKVYLGRQGLITSAAPGTLLVDMTTSCPLLARRIAEAALTQNLEALDAPVSGGDIGAREKRLTIMVGGNEEGFQRVLPYLQCLGSNILLQGPAGAGQLTKLCNQIAIAANMMGVCEAITFAQKSGLDPRQVLASIGGGAAGSWSLQNLTPRMLDGDFTPGFYVKHFIKDMRLALETAEAMQLKLPGLELAHRLYKQLADQGGSDDGTQALFKLYQARF